jgi:hypothetical protein
MRGQEYPGADLRGWLLACVIRVSARTGLPWRLGAYPHEYASASTAEDGRRQRTPYQWVIEGDIKGCFDNIDHHQLMKRVRARVTDGKVTRLIAQFLKA